MSNRLFAAVRVDQAQNRTVGMVDNLVGAGMLTSEQGNALLAEVDKLVEAHVARARRNFAAELETLAERMKS